MASNSKNENNFDFKNKNGIINISKDNNSNNPSNNNIIDELYLIDENKNNNNQEKSNLFFKNFIIDIKDKKNKSFRCSEKDYKEKNLLKEKDKKIEVLKEQCEALQKQLQMKTDYIIKEKEKATKIINSNFSDANMYFNLNTSTNFPMKSEIKKTWEEFALISILDNFIDYENQPELIFFFVTEMIVILHDLINNICADIYKKVSASLGIPNDQKLICDIEKTSRPLIKEHLNKIFISTEEKPFINQFINLYKNSLNQKFGELKIEQIINTSDFYNMIKKIKDILLFTKFNDQQLFFKIEKDFSKRMVERIKIKTNIEKKKYLIINDNNKEPVDAIVLLKPPVLRSGFTLNNDFKTILILYEKDSNSKSYNNLNSLTKNTHINKNENKKGKIIPSHIKNKSYCFAYNKSNSNNNGIYFIKGQNDKKQQNNSQIEKGKNKNEINNKNLIRKIYDYNDTKRNEKIPNFSCRIPKNSLLLPHEDYFYFIRPAADVQHHHAGTGRGGHATGFGPGGHTATEGQA